MRCYFMRGSRIANVEFLKDAPDDELIQQALVVFEKHTYSTYDGFGRGWSRPPRTALLAARCRVDAAQAGVPLSPYASFIRLSPARPAGRVPQGRVMRRQGGASHWRRRRKR